MGDATTTMPFGFKTCESSSTFRGANMDKPTSTEAVANGKSLCASPTATCALPCNRRDAAFDAAGDASKPAKFTKQLACVDD